MMNFASKVADRGRLEGFERWASGLASTAMGSWGVRRGGWMGLLALAGAGFLAWRAGTGQSLVPGMSRPKSAPALPAPKRATRRAKPRATAKARPQETQTPKDAAPKPASRASAPRTKSTEAKPASAKSTGAKSTGTKSTGTNSTGTKSKSAASASNAAKARSAKTNGAHVPKRRAPAAKSQKAPAPTPS